MCCYENDWNYNDYIFFFLCYYFYIRIIGFFLILLFDFSDVDHGNSYYETHSY